MMTEILHDEIPMFNIYSSTEYYEITAINCETPLVTGKVTIILSQPCILPEMKFH